MADMKKPRVAIADTDVPNAFATGRSPNNAVVCATSGLMRRLDEARARGGPGPRALPRRPPRRGRDDHRQLPRHGGRHGHPDDAVDRDDGRLRRGRPEQQQPGRATMPRWSSWPCWSSRWSSTPSASCLTMALSRYRELAADRSGRAPHRTAVGAGLGPGQGDRATSPASPPATCARPRPSTPSTSPRPSPRTG